MSIIDAIKKGNIPGPQSHKFKREDWESLFESDLTADERNLVECGLLFDQYLCNLRAESNIKSLAINKDVLIQSAIAIATSDINLAKKQVQQSFTQPVNAIDIMKPLIKGMGDTMYTIEELVTSMGDSLNLVLKEILKTSSDENQSIDADIKPLIKNVGRELSIAVCYLMYEEYWLRCIHFGFQLTFEDGQLRFVSKDTAFETRRVASTFRHRKLLIDDCTATWNHVNEFPNELKKRFSRQGLVTKTSGNKTVDSIDVGFSKKAFSHSMPALWSRMINEQSFYFPYLQQPQKNFNGLNYSQLINGWCFLQSLACEINHNNPTLEKGGFDANNLKNISPQISENVLISALAKSIDSPYAVAKNIINALTFRGEQSQELWSQPLLRLENGFCLAIPCIQAAHLERVLESWMRQSSFDFAIKGPEFENFCRLELNTEIQSSELKGKVQMSDGNLNWKHNGVAEEIDLIIVFNQDTVLLVEIKCVLWPDSALQFSNYYKQVESGVNQISRKKKWIEDNKEAFSLFLKKHGIEVSEHFNIEACVLTNSAILAGFPQNGVAVIDLAILQRFFTNRLCLIAQMSNGEIEEVLVQRFFEKPESAGAVLRAYLQNPPQLDLFKKNIKAREVSLPFDFNNKPVIFEEIEVGIDTEAVLRSHGL